MAQATKIFNALLESLSPRQKEVVVARYGLGKGGGDGETLEAIGRRFGITRERVRQIENSALDLLSKNLNAYPACVQIIERGKGLLKVSGGAQRKETLLKNLGKSVEGITDGHLAALLKATDAFNVYPEDKHYWPFYYLTKDDLKNALGFVDSWASFLRSHKDEVLAGGYEVSLNNFIKNKKLNKNHAESYLNVAKKIRQNPYGDSGLAEWPEIRPQTTRDKIYLVLKKKGEPMHFEAIAGLINEVKFGESLALAPTVHNELIKDPRFVLVGRGIYALRELGYEPGTAREVIHKILKRQGPLHPTDVIKHVSKQRFFKPNTILINLQNKSHFERLADGRYRLREA